MMMHLFSKTVLLLVSLLLVGSDLAQASESKSTNTLLTEGDRYWAENKLDLAEQSYRKAVEQDAGSIEARKKLGGFLLRQNRFTEAVVQFQAAISLDPSNAKLFVVLGVAYLHQGVYPLAQAAAEEALKLDPDLKAARDLHTLAENKMTVMDQVHMTQGRAHPPVNPGHPVRKKTPRSRDSKKTDP